MCNQIEASIIRIINLRGKVLGAGFLVSKKLAFTCAHVIRLALELSSDADGRLESGVHIDFPLAQPGRVLKALVVQWYPDQDIAGLELTEIPTNAHPTPLVSSELLWGHEFRVFGFPRGYEKTGIYASGELRGKLTPGWIQIQDVQQIGYSVAQGFSGGPVWDEVIGGGQSC